MSQIPFDINRLVRANIAALKPYSCARDEFKGEASIYLDANESPFNAPFNRYPDPHQWVLKERIEALKGVPAQNQFLGVGSDEAIDLLYRAFCEPAVDNVVAITPTYGMYQVCADINNVQYNTAQLTAHFELNVEAVLAAVNEHTKIIWLCSPNNPTGNDLALDRVEELLRKFNGLVVIDEAYIDFAGRSSWSKRLAEFPNMVVLQTLSKAWGSAAIRLGMAFASEAIIGILNKIKYPYNINMLTQQQALNMLEQEGQVANWVATLLEQRSWLQKALQSCLCVKQLYPTDANFLLMRVTDANAIYRYLIDKGVVVRNRNNITLCEGCLRITVGTAEENRELIALLHAYG